VGRLGRQITGTGCHAPQSLPFSPPYVLAYLHIPFCHRVCPYCSFYKHTPGSTPIPEFIKALITEARNRIPSLPEPPRTLFLGGGTPSMLSPTHLEMLFTGLRQHFNFSQLEEVTLEANPATFDLAKARLFRDLGITRVSLGIQSFNAAVLQTLGREHTSEQAVRSVEILHQSEIPSINIDLMFSIPGQSLADWQHTLDQATALQPHHISAYNLTYEEDTAFFESLLKGEMSEDEAQDREHFLVAHQTLTSKGFEHYETSNYARSGHHSRHNQGYWKGENYIGLGPSAVSTIDRTRSTNVKDTGTYVAMLHALKDAIGDIETLDSEDFRLERIAMGLRTHEGISLDLLKKEGLQRAHELSAYGLLEIHENTLALTLRGSALVDAIVTEIA
jgi:oxygen-independent coproporphyrinogen III oxidase